ncbi:MAG: YceD family protein [Eubacteriaceae bacterium]
MIINISGLLKGQEKILNIETSIPNFIDELIGNYLNISGYIKALNNELIIELNVKLKTKMKCSRCLDDFDYELNTEVSEKYNLDDAQEIIENDNINLTELIRENVLINIPIKAICDVNCKGLCPTCGKNKNIQSCNCDSEQFDPRLSILSNFLDGDE